MHLDTPHNIWMYWEGPMPPYIELCIRTVRNIYPDARLLSHETFKEIWIHDTDVPIDHLGPVHRSDFIRAYLLRYHGGLWLDVDFVLLKPLTVLLNLPEHITFCGYMENEEFYANNFIFSKLNDAVIREFYLTVKEHLINQKPIDWLEIGSYALTPAVKNNYEHVLTLAQSQINPIPWHETQRFEKSGALNSILDSDPYGVMLSNNSMSDVTKQMPAEEITGSNTLLGELLRRTLSANASKSC